MRAVPVRWCGVLLAVVSGAGSAAAQQTTPPAPAAAPAQKPPPKPPPKAVVRVTGDLGYVSSSGNSSVQTLNFGQKITAKIDKLQFTEQFSLVHGRSKGETVSSLWRATVRGDYALPSVFGSYISVGFERNTFSGLRSRIVGNVGLTAHVLRQERQKLMIESGLSLTAQRHVAQNKPNIDALGGRAAFVYNQRIGERAGAKQSIEILPNFRQSEKLRVNTETEVTAPLTKQVALKLAFTIRYDGAPAKNYQTTDRWFTSGVSVSF